MPEPRGRQPLRGGRWPIPTGTGINPTLTIMANAWRVAEHIANGPTRRGSRSGHRSRFALTISELNDHGINRLGEPLVEEQLAYQAVLLVEPVRHPERDHRRRVEERQSAVMGGGRKRLKTGVVTHGGVVAARRKSTPWARSGCCGIPADRLPRYRVQPVRPELAASSTSDKRERPCALATGVLVAAVAVVGMDPPRRSKINLAAGSQEGHITEQRRTPSPVRAINSQGWLQPRQSTASPNRRRLYAREPSEAALRSDVHRLRFGGYAAWAA